MNRIQLGNTVFEGRNDVYVLDGEQTVLVDVGASLPDVREQLQSGLADFGLAVADVDEVFLTHWHYDHSGLVGELQAESGATVRVHADDAGLVAGDDDLLTAHDDLLLAYLDEWNLPDDARETLLDYLEFHDVLGGDPADVTPFVDGDRFDVNGRELEVVHLPGHAKGLCAFAFDGESGDDESAVAAGGGREAFVGDAILPKYTPNVGGADLRVDAPLTKYVDSLHRLVECDFARAWPGHRDVIDAPTDRALTILDHHRERTENVVSVLREHGPCDTWTVSAHLFGDLEDIHILHGPGEAYAHLDHLESHGVVERDGVDYVLVDDDPDVGALFPAVDERVTRRD